MRLAPQDLVWMGLDGLDGDGVEDLFRPGGIILFARNLDGDPVAGPRRCHALIQTLQRRWAVDRPLAVALDQEGGAVSRLKVWVGATPTLRAIWQQGGAPACARWGSLWGRGLKMLGFNVDFAPVADLFDGHPGTGLGDRAASPDPFETAMAAGAFLAGLEGEGVRGCLKHYPGLGGTRVDSHLALPELKDMAQITANLKPFRALAHADRMVMVAHLRLPSTAGMPASLHRGSVAGNPWGIRARWIPDDLEMGGCSNWDWDERVRLCMEAGQQALLVCQTTEGIRQCAEAAGRMPETLWRPGAEAFWDLRRLLAGSLQSFPQADWDAWVAEMRAEAASA